MKKLTITPLKRHLIWLTGVLIFALIIFSSIQLYNFLISLQNQEYQESLKRVELVLQKQRQEFIYGMQGAKGVYVVKDLHPTSKDFRKYSASRGFFKNFPAVMGFGFIRYVPNKRLNQFKKDWFLIHKSGIKTIDTLYSEKFSDKFIIEIIEPIEVNRPALGLDIGSERTRREAAWKAAKSGEVTITGPIELVQDQTKESGFLIYLPIYRDETQSIENLEGWVYAPLRISLFVKEILSIVDRNIEFEITTVDSEEKKYILFSNIQNTNQLLDKNIFKTSVNMGNRTWNIRAVPIYSFNDKLIRVLPWILMFIALAAILLLYLWIERLSLKTGEAIGLYNRAESWNEAVLNSSSYSIISTTPDGVIHTFNNAAEKLLGYKAAEMVLKQTPAIIHLPEEVVQKAEQFTQELGRPVEIGFDTFIAKCQENLMDINDWTYVRKDGSTFPVRLCVTALKDREGQIFGYLGIAEDLTEQKKMLKQIEVQQAQIFNSAKMSSLGEMAGGIAHEINNPLAIISATATFVQNKINLNKIDHQALLKDMDKIITTVERISKIIKGLRKFSRKSDLDRFEEQDLEFILNDTLELCFGRFRDSDISFEVSEIPKVLINCRPVEISQVFMNLLNNAIDAIDLLNEKWVKINFEQNNSSIIIHITDSGHGIDSHIEQKIMEPFFTTKDVGKGTGLGLSISLGIAQAHGGNLRYQKAGGHSRFSLELPIVKN